MSEQPKDGGRAFPDQEGSGMSLRDWFAGQAMFGIISAEENEELTFDQLAHMSYLQADAMLAERKRLQ